MQDELTRRLPIVNALHCLEMGYTAHQSSACGHKGLDDEFEDDDQIEPELESDLDELDAELDAVSAQ